MLDARQTGRSRPAPPKVPDVLVDLRDPNPDTIVAGTLRHEVRTTLGADWDARGSRW